MKKIMIYLLIMIGVGICLQGTIREIYASTENVLLHAENTNENMSEKTDNSTAPEQNSTEYDLDIYGLTCPNDDCW